MGQLIFFSYHSKAKVEAPCFKETFVAYVDVIDHHIHTDYHAVRREREITNLRGIYLGGYLENCTVVTKPCHSVHAHVYSQILELHRGTCTAHAAA